MPKGPQSKKFISHTNLKKKGNRYFCFKMPKKFKIPKIDKKLSFNSKLNVLLALRIHLMMMRIYHLNFFWKKNIDLGQNKNVHFYEMAKSC